MKSLNDRNIRQPQGVDWESKFAHCTKQMRRSSIRELLKLTAQSDMISFAGGLPAAELFPIAEVKAAADRVLSQQGGRALQYSESEGLGNLRDWIAAKASRAGLPVTRANVVIFNGGQQALDMIGRVFLNPGDKVFTENPTYLALLSAWRPLGVKFVAVPGDAEGIMVSELEPLLGQHPKLLYSIPNFQNPSGTTLRVDRRPELVQLLRTHGVGLVEDDPYGELRYDGEAPLSLFECDARVTAKGRLDTNVVRVGTFSKVLSPGLRVGWAMGAEEVMDKLVQARQAADLHPNTLSQYIVSDLLEGGVLDRQIPILRTAYRERRDAMLSALAKYFPKGASWTKPDGGMFLMVTLPPNIRAIDLLSKAIERKVAFVPGEDFHVNGEGHNTMRVNFSNASPALIEEGIKRLSEVLKTELGS